MTLRIRKGLERIQDDYLAGNKKELEDLMRAWKGIKELPPDDPNSFFMIGGYHGEPFRGAGWGNASYWGGYCNHGNVLFPTWHRVYLLRLENALRSVAGCADVTLPYWDETSGNSLNAGIPWALTAPTFELDGQVIPNPLKSFVFPRAINDNISTDNPDYAKPGGYETVRYPLAGLMGPGDIAKTLAHNAQFPDAAKNVEILNGNVVNWLTSAIVVNGQTIPTNLHQKYIDCLSAPNYTVFSNTSSAAEWNTNLSVGEPTVVPLESPHNSIHLAVGGCEVPGFDVSPIDGANGDMGENDTAGLDPIFFFHHCFVDRMFWLWQRRHHATDALAVIPQYPGTNSVDSQGPTPGMAPNSWLTLDSPLDPFVLDDQGTARPYTSRDCIHIERQMGYTYAPGSLEDLVAAPAAAVAQPRVKTVRVTRLNRGAISGSFLIVSYAVIDGKRLCLGTEAILSRWHVSGCMNCQAHLEAKAFLAVPAGIDASAGGNHIEVEVRTHAGLLGQRQALDMASIPGTVVAKQFRVEVR